MLEKLELREWRQFTSVDLTFHRQMTLLVGANGSGKTTVLKLLAKQFGWAGHFVANYELDVAENEYRYHAIQKSVPEGNGASKKIGSLHCDDQQIDIIVPVNNAPVFDVNYHLKSHPKGLFIPAIRPNFMYRKIDSMPNFPPDREAMFDAFRKYMQQYSEDLFRSTGKALGSQELANSAVFQIKENLSALAMFGYDNKYIKGDAKARALFEGYIEILHKILPPKLGFKSIEIRPPEVVLATDSGDFPLDASSGGMSSLLSIAWQIFLCEDTGKPFVILFDEPENHLHPELQRILLPSLMDAFPLAQFIVATHNPVIVSSVQDSSVYGFVFNEEHKVVSQEICAAKSATADRILTEILGLKSSIPAWVDAELRKILGKYSEHPLTESSYEGLKKDLSVLGLADYFPKAISAVVCGDAHD